MEVLPWGGVKAKKSEANRKQVAVEAEGKIMKGKEFAKIRHHLDKTQSELARLMCVSIKGIQSFEQGWRKIPPHAERDLLFLMYMKQDSNNGSKPCWEVKTCPAEWRENCSAWEFQAGKYCWFIGGTCCDGQENVSWKEKIGQCKQCEIYQAFMRPVLLEI